MANMRSYYSCSSRLLLATTVISILIASHVFEVIAAHSRGPNHVHFQQKDKHNLENKVRIPEKRRRSRIFLANKYNKKILEDFKSIYAGNVNGSDKCKARKRQLQKLGQLNYH